MGVGETGVGEMGVGETGVGETGVGEQVPISDFHHLTYVSGNEVLMVQFKVMYYYSTLVDITLYTCTCRVSMPTYLFTGTCIWPFQAILVQGNTKSWPEWVSADSVMGVYPYSRSM